MILCILWYFSKMSTVLNYGPGSQVTVLLQIIDELPATVDGYYHVDGYSSPLVSGVRVDGYSLPVVSRIIFPDLSLAAGYPANMIRIDTGLYYHKFTLPIGAVAVGTYIVDLSYTNAQGDPKRDFVQVICSAVGGIFSVSPG